MLALWIVLFTAVLHTNPDSFILSGYFCCALETVSGWATLVDENLTNDVGKMFFVSLLQYALSCRPEKDKPRCVV